jgi:N-methylhydantoinase A
VTLRLRAVGLLPRPRLPKIASGTGRVEAARKGERPVYRPGLTQREYQAGYAVYDRLRLHRADRIAGPAIIEEPTSTTLLHAGDALTVGEYGELVLTIGELP